MAIIACIAYLLIMAAVIAWLVHELRMDKRDRIEPTVPAPRERMPPKDGL